jgi:hypothetical protein
MQAVAVERLDHGPFEIGKGQAYLEAALKSVAFILSGRKPEVPLRAKRFADSALRVN